MRRLIESLTWIVFGMGVALLLTGVALAANFTVTFSSGQDTQIQTRLVPMYNRFHCAQFGLGASCTTPNLTSAGCVAKVVKTVTVDSCTIFTQDSTGEGLFLQEMLNQKLADVFFQLNGTDAIDACANFKALSGSSQNAICSSLSLPNGCSICP